MAKVLEVLEDILDNPLKVSVHIYTDIRDSKITPVILLVNWQFIRYDFSNFLKYCVVIFLSIMIWQFSENVCVHFVCQLSFQKFFEVSLLLWEVRKDEQKANLMAFTRVTIQTLKIFFKRYFIHIILM